MIELNLKNDELNSLDLSLKPAEEGERGGEREGGEREEGREDGENSKMKEGERKKKEKEKKEKIYMK